MLRIWRSCLVVTMLWVALAAGASPASEPEAASGAGRAGIRHVGPDYNQGKPLSLADQPDFRAAQSEETEQPPGEKAGKPKVGVRRTWLGLDDVASTIYLKDYTLRGIGRHVEVWIASASSLLETLDFPFIDCRNGERTRIADDQVNYLVDEFDKSIYPKESKIFSVPPARDGRKALLPKLIPGLAKNTYQGDGNKVVVLIDNIRDESFYDTDNATNSPYIAGFFYSIFNDAFDRNVITLDGYDWLHRTGAKPPDNPVPGDNCASAPARPFLYEGTLAHEYQHLLEHYEDPDEALWINEGLSTWAESLTGYQDPSVPITKAGFSGHIQCFLGHLGTQTPANPNPREGGPENSLTVWEDQGAGEILCDYGAAYTMMEFLHGRYGDAFMSRLHRDDTGGLAALGDLLAESGPGAGSTEVVGDWAAMAALDEVLDDGATLTGADPKDLTTPTLDAGINWDTRHAYDTPGAPPNGSDYLRVRDGQGAYLAASAIESLSFDGAGGLPPMPIEWTVDPNGHADGDGALHSGSGAGFDRSIVRSLAVPQGGGALTFDTRYQTEAGFDFGFVQVSTDGGQTFKSLPATTTTSEADPGAQPPVTTNLPGYSSDSKGWIAEKVDLSAYQGQTILLAFRYVTDSGVNGAGWWIDNLAIGGAPFSDGLTLDGWRTLTQINPITVSGFTV
ncbi:MAG: choice-of-anchor J domain-containing protein, partial [Actinomycetota bacterium]